jgi:dTDP-4-dehydrorhamnose 3,5-epimerase
MIFEETILKGAFIIKLEQFGDNRGFFARAWCQKEFGKLAIENRIAQANLSFNLRKGTLRGMHYQVSPYEETKLVRCFRGAIYDVIVDLRPSSLTYRKWIGVELTDQNRWALFVPQGFAHGFQTLEDQTEVFYQVSEFYTPGAERGARYNDPAFGIEWPLPVSVISDKDAAWEDYQS